MRPAAPTAPGLLTRAARSKADAQMTEVSSFSPFALPTVSSTAVGKQCHCLVVDSSSDEISDSSNKDTPKKPVEMPPSVTIPQVNVEMASPPHGKEEKTPIVTGDVLFFIHSHF